MSNDLPQETGQALVSSSIPSAGRRKALHALGAAAIGLSGVRAVAAKDNRNQAGSEKKKKAKRGPTGPTGPTGPGGGNANIPNPLKSIAVESSDGTTPAIILRMVNNQDGPLMVLQSAAGAELLRLTAEDGNTWVGRLSGSEIDGGSQDNTGIGSQSLANLTTANANTAVGANALQLNFIGSGNTAIGVNALRNATLGPNVAVGNDALSSLINGSQNIAVGVAALANFVQGARNTAIGDAAMALDAGPRVNCTALGANAEVDGNNQVQLGDSQTIPYAYNALNLRSDLRDKTDVRNTSLGLEFIQALRPVDFRYDFREDYRTAPPTPPASSATPAEFATYQRARADWKEASRFANLQGDGSKARTRFHHGLIAQEVAEVITRTGIDFGGYQDHTVNGGEDVRSIGYTEFIAPLIKAVQELAARNAELETRLRAIESSREAL